MHTVVNLAGAGVGDAGGTPSTGPPSSPPRVREATRTIVAAIERPASRSLVNGSAVGRMAIVAREVLTESSPRGVGFLAEVVRAWETPPRPLAEEAGRPAARPHRAGDDPARRRAPARCREQPDRGWYGWLGQAVPADHLPGDEVAALMHPIDHPRSPDRSTWSASNHRTTRSGRRVGPARAPPERCMPAPGFASGSWSASSPARSRPASGWCL